MCVCVCVCVCVFCVCVRETEREGVVGTSFLTKPSTCTSTHSEQCHLFGVYVCMYVCACVRVYVHAYVCVRVGTFLISNL